MNIELITIISYNYGNRLQNYALQTYLEKRGCKVITSRLDERANPLYENHFREWRVVTDPDTMKLYRSFDNNIHWKEDLKSHLADDPYIDHYIAGSDQIWNPMFDFGSDREFLRFADPRKRVAYSASIGIGELPEERIASYRDGLLGIKNISMRENAGADIVERLTGERPPVTLDPTMLLTEEEWETISRTSTVKIDDDFVVKYFLGIRNEECDAKINEYARTHNCRVVDLINHKDMGIKGIGPAEFLYLIKHSKANFVDSFHGAVFSVLFQKPFIASYRPNQKEFGDMNSRFDTLFDTFDLKDRFISRADELGHINDEIDHVHVQSVLKQKREDANAFLLNALNMG